MKTNILTAIIAGIITVVICYTIDHIHLKNTKNNYIERYKCDSLQEAAYIRGTKVDLYLIDSILQKNYYENRN